jgi:hypothetical protein
MTVIESVQSILTSDASLDAIFPEGQIFAPGARQAVSRPYMVHFPVTIAPSNVHRGTPPNVIWGYQVSIFAETLEAGEEAALLVIAAMHGQHSLGSPISDRLSIQFTGGGFYAGREDEEDIEHFVVEFAIQKSL